MLDEPGRSEWGGRRGELRRGVPHPREELLEKRKCIGYSPSNKSSEINPMKAGFDLFEDWINASDADVEHGDEILVLNDTDVSNLYDIFKTNHEQMLKYHGLKKIVENHIIAVTQNNVVKMVSGEVFSYVPNQSVDGIPLHAIEQVDLGDGIYLIYLPFDGILLTPKDKSDLELYFARARMASRFQSKEKGEERIRAQAVGGPRVKVKTKQLRKKVGEKKKTGTKKSGKGGGRKITGKEKEYMMAKRVQQFGDEEEARKMNVPEAPKRLQPISGEEMTRRRENLRAAEGVVPTLIVPKNIMDICFPTKKKLRDYQIKSVRHILQNRGQIAVHSVGSGKTLIAATSAVCVLKSDPNIKVIFVSPKSLKTNFERTVQENFEQFDPKTGMGVDLARIHMYTYEKFRLDHAKGLVDCRNVFLIVDEAHKLRTHKDRKTLNLTITVESIIKCAAKANKVLLLTATPVVNEPFDVTNLVSIVRGESNPTSIQHFRSAIFWYPRGKDIGRGAWIPKKGPEFDSYFRNIFTFYQRPEDDTYPSVEIHTVEIPMSQKYYQEYMRVETLLITRTQEEVLGPAGKLEPFYNGVRRTVNADVEEFNTKLDWVKDHLLKAYFGPGVSAAQARINMTRRKIIIFSPFISLGVKQLEILAADLPVKPAMGEITGADTEAKRQQTIDMYNSGKLTLLLISVGAGGLGINLIGTRDVVIMQPGWNEVEMEQAMGRAVRFHSHTHLPPNERKVDVWKLLLVKPPGVGGNLAIDQTIEHIIQRKNQVNKPFLELLKGLGV